MKAAMEMGSWGAMGVYHNKNMFSAFFVLLKASTFLFRISISRALNAIQLSRLFFSNLWFHFR